MEEMELKPCPFCGCKEPNMAISSNNFRWVECLNCGAAGGTADNEEFAAKLWNERCSEGDKP